MRDHLWRRCGLATVVIVFVIIAGCGSGVTIDSADDIGDALEREGLIVESREPVPQPKSRHVRFDETIALNGPELRVEIIRINDERVYKIARSMGVIFALGENAAGQRFPGRPDLYMSQPYMIVVRQEPESGQVQAALQKILNFDEED